MIKSNLMPSRPKGTAAVANGAPQALKGKGIKIGSKKPASKGRFSSIVNIFYMLVVFMIAAVLYLQLFGVPGFLRGYLPQEIIDLLGLTEETAASQVLREAGVVKLTAYGTRADDPSSPINGTVEEVVKTMRPDIYITDKLPTNYKEQALSNRIPYQKQAFHIMLSTFYKATPDGIGYLDLAYQAPNFYFARAVALDSRTRNTFLNQLRAKVNPDIVVRDSSMTKDGLIELSVLGSIVQPDFDSLKRMPLIKPSRVKSEIMALRTLAVANQVRLIGWEKPIEEELETYRRVILRTTTEADYPSLLNFAEALQKSDLAFGVQQFVSRPQGVEKMQSAIEFVLYATM
ncbi:MAG: hypothetical protein FWB90_05720 [Fibromonadales bacterium]|nr:hypothetical protein [Fibromonadales bacterium]